MLPYTIESNIIFPAKLFLYQQLYDLFFIYIIFLDYLLEFYILKN